MPTYRDNPDAIFDVTLTADAGVPELLRVAHAMVPAWADATDALRTVIEGGITHQLLRLRAAGRPSLLFRIFGRNTEVMIDRETENRLFAELSCRCTARPAPVPSSSPTVTTWHRAIRSRWPSRSQA